MIFSRDFIMKEKRRAKAVLEMIKENKIMIGIGIDNGGTYTDAVIYDFEAKKIKGEAKALTTMEDLKKGITKALQKLPGGRSEKAEMVVLSTTLATNICVENRGERRSLFLSAYRKRP